MRDVLANLASLAVAGAALFAIELLPRRAPVQAHAQPGATATPDASALAEPSPERGSWVVRGRVLEAETGAPIEGVVVELVGAGATLVSGSDGSFRVPLPPGTRAARLRVRPGGGWQALAPGELEAAPGAEARLLVRRSGPTQSAIGSRQPGAPAHGEPPSTAK